LGNREAISGKTGSGELTRYPDQDIKLAITTIKEIKMLKKLSIRAEDSTLSLLGDLMRKNNKEPNPAGGAGYIVDMFQGLYRKTLIKIKGMFTAQDLHLLLDVTNGLILSPGFAGQHILADVEDGITLARLDMHHKVNSAELLKKIGALSIPERALIEIWLKGYWEQHGTDNAVSLEDYITPIL